MYRLIKFSRGKKRSVGFLGIKKKTSQVFAQVLIVKIQIEKFSSDIWIFNNYKLVGIISKKTNIGPNICYNYNVVNKKKKKEDQESNPEQHQVVRTFS